MSRAGAGGANTKTRALAAFGSKPDALRRLYQSLEMIGQPANKMDKLAILTRDS